MEQSIPLEPGLNYPRISVRTENGREVQRALMINRVLEPALRILVNQPPDPQPVGALTVSGLIQWTQDSAREFIADVLKRMRVVVNGFQQPPVRADPAPSSPGQREQRFTAALALTRAKDNLIEVLVDAPNVPREAGVPRRFRLDCTNPVQPKRLHVLVVGVFKDIGRRVGNQLMDEIFRALRVERRGRGGRNAVFEEVIWHDPLTGDLADIGKIRSALRKIPQPVNRGEGSSDVVLLYWQGQESVTAQGEWCLLDRDGFPLTDRELNEIPGARVLLLDVTRPALPTEACTALNLRASLPYIAAVRYVWPGAAPAPGLVQALVAVGGQAAGAIKPDAIAKKAEELRPNLGPPPPTLEDNLNLASGSPHILAGQPLG